MTIEEKAKAYDEALKRAKELNKEHQVACGINFCEEIFPELAGSEDERIRKCLLKYFENRGSNGVIWNKIGISRDNVLSWLEKQGKENNTCVINNTPNCGISVYNEECKESDDEEVRCAIIDHLKDHNLIEWATWLEKQSEQKPKFKVGDWITDNKDALLQVTKFEIDYGYELKAIDGQIFHFVSPDFVDANYHLWTIKDAKDGDVLYHKSPLNGIEYIVMSSGINGYGNVDSYFRYNSVDGFATNIPSVFSAKLDDISPATKEQRDLLFAKMHEAGYMWDEEKKELKEIEQKPIEWSEEDEHRRTDAIYFLETAKKHYASTSEIDATIEWLKSFKERMG